LFTKIELKGHIELGAIVIDCKNISEFDTTALEAFLEMSKDWRNRGIFVYLAKVRPNVKQRLERAGIIKFLGGEENVLFQKATSAVEFYVNSLKVSVGYQTIEIGSGENSIGVATSTSTVVASQVTSEIPVFVELENPEVEEPLKKNE
jgi:anti-anti-sigma regulatory factor